MKRIGGRRHPKRMSVPLQRGILVLSLIGAIPCPAQDSDNKRAFGVIPNNRSVEASIPFTPISAKRKMTIAYKDSFDWPVFPTAAAFAALYQLEDQNPSFGQGMKGYAKRFATSYGDQMIGN